MNKLNQCTQTAIRLIFIISYYINHEQGESVYPNGHSFFNELKLEI